MMPRQVLDLLSPLRAAFTKFQMDEATSHLYVDHLKDLDIADLEAAVRTCIRTCRFFPAISEILEAARESRIDRLPSSPKGPEARSCQPQDDPLSPDEWKRLLPPLSAQPLSHGLKNCLRPPSQEWVDEKIQHIVGPKSVSDTGPADVDQMKRDIRTLRRKLMSARAADAIEDALDRPLEELNPFD